MSALPFAYAWRWKGGVTWKLTLTKNPNAHRGLEIKELFDHSDLAATVIEQQAEIERLRWWLSEIDMRGKQYGPEDLADLALEGLAGKPAQGVQP